MAVKHDLTGRFKFKGMWGRLDQDIPFEESAYQSADSEKELQEFINLPDRVYYYMELKNEI